MACKEVEKKYGLCIGRVAAVFARFVLCFGERYVCMCVCIWAGRALGLAGMERSVIVGAEGFFVVARSISNVIVIFLCQLEVEFFFVCVCVSINYRFKFKKYNIYVYI